MEKKRGQFKKRYETGDKRKTIEEAFSGDMDGQEGGWENPYFRLPYIPRSIGEGLGLKRRK